MEINILWGAILPFVGTVLGAACVFFLRGEMKNHTQRIFLGFAAGVMMAASVWSLLLPALSQSQRYEKFAFVPAALGLIIGMLFLLLLDKLVPHINPASRQEEGVKNSFKESTKLFFAVTLHNIPEGIAVGVVFAGLLAENAEISLSSALALSVGIAIQNFPEGAIISMPILVEDYIRMEKCALAGENVMLRFTRKLRAFLYGGLSGVVEPIATFITILFAKIMVPVLPYLLSFAAGAMIYVIIEELLPQVHKGEHSDVGVVAFFAGFALMMVLDVTFG